MLETCAVCGAEVPFKHTVHVVLNPGGEEGVVDHYVCRSCYDDDLAPLFDHPGGEDDAGDGAVDEAGEGGGVKGAVDEAGSDTTGGSGGEVVDPSDDPSAPED